MPGSFKLPPVKTSTTSTEIVKTLSDKDFDVVNKRAMLKLESAARYFDMTVEDTIAAVEYIKHNIGIADHFVIHKGRHYIATPVAMTCLLQISPYREALCDQKFFDRVFDDMQYELVTNPEFLAIDPKRKSKFQWSFDGAVRATGLGFMLVMALLYHLVVPSSKPNDQPSTPPATVETQSSVEPSTRPAVSTPPLVSGLHLDGRGADAISELSYVGLNGFVVIQTAERYELLENNDYLNTPWQVPTYERDKQFWNKTDQTLDHKTPVRVREQFISQDKRWDWYKGYLLVERQSDGAQFYISVGNFVLKPYWIGGNVESAIRPISGGGTLVEYHQRSDYWPVTHENRKVELHDGTILFADAPTGTFGSGWVQKSTHQIEAYSSECGWVYFNKADVDLVY